MLYQKVQKGKGLSVRSRRPRKGAVLVEYGLLVAGIALIAMAAVSVLGHKTTDLFATVAAVIPGAHQDDNHPIQSGHLIETAVTGDGAIALDPQGILAANGTARLNSDVFGNSGELGLVLESGNNLTQK